MAKKRIRGTENHIHGCSVSCRESGIASLAFFLLFYAKPSSEPVSKGLGVQPFGRHGSLVRKAPSLAFSNKASNMIPMV